MNPVVESLRVIGALMVVTHHYTYQLSPELADQWSGLHFFHNGVDLFFVITGFLFAPLLLADRPSVVLTDGSIAGGKIVGGKPVTAGKFLKRRFFRLYPLYLLSLITFVLSGAIPLPSPNLLLEHLLLIQNLPWNSLADAGAISLVYWTLAVEIQFYCFVLLITLVYRYVNINHKSRVLFTISLIGFFSSAYLNYAPRSETWVLWQAQLPALLLEFCFGVWAYQYVNGQYDNGWYDNGQYVKGWHSKQRSILLLLAGVLMLSLLYLYYPSLMDESLSARPFGWFNAASAMAYALVLAGWLDLVSPGRRSPRSRSPGRRPPGRRPPERRPPENQSATKAHASKLINIALFCGGLSYPVYLFHEIAIRWLQNGLSFLAYADQEILVLQALIVTLLLAIPLNRWVEIPFREYGRR